MSGGVDSSVSALLLKQKGYDVIGATLELFNKESSSNNGTDLDAKNICKSMGIPHFTFDYQKEFKKYVIDDFIDCYANCKTPNPCIECNKYMKFGFMYEKAKEMGCNYIATGHYAKTEYSEIYKRWVLKKSNAGRKDQSYVLWNIPKNLIEHIIFPLSDFESKDEIRDIAKKNNLNVANKPDSEDICFIPDGNYKKFLEANSNIKPKIGNIVNSKGEVLGKHTGLYNYTIGQRRGLGISNKVPLFVLGFNNEKNELIVGEKKELYKETLDVKDINLLLVDKIEDWLEVEVKTRYSAKQAKAKIVQDENNIKVKFDEPQRALTPGQSAVFYLGDIVLGGRKNQFIKAWFKSWKGKNFIMEYTYERKINYYETDKMGIVHHSNYIRYMEEARCYWLDKLGMPFSLFEENNITIPVLGVSCDYKQHVTFNDTILINIYIKSYSGVRLTVGYNIQDKNTGKTVLIGESKHCFTDKNLKPINLKKHKKEFSDKFENLLAK